MQRRRKRNRAAAANKRQPGVKLDKSLPSLPPPEELEANSRAAAAAAAAAAADDPIADSYDATTEVASRGAAPALDSARFEDNNSNIPTPRPFNNDDDDDGMSSIPIVLFSIYS